MGATRSDSPPRDSERVLGMPTLSPSLQPQVCVGESLAQDEKRVWSATDVGDVRGKRVEGKVLPRTYAAIVSVPKMLHAFMHLGIRLVLTSEMPDLGTLTKDLRVENGINITGRLTTNE